VSIFPRFQAIALLSGCVYFSILINRPFCSHRFRESLPELQIKTHCKRIRSKRHGKRTAEVLFGSAICFINGLFFTTEVPIAIGIGDTIPAHFERILVNMGLFSSSKMPVSH